MQTDNRRTQTSEVERERDRLTHTEINRQKTRNKDNKGGVRQKDRYTEIERGQKRTRDKQEDR